MSIPGRMFPLQTSRRPGCAPGPLSIPWSVAEVAYGAYAREYGKSQSLERLAERGGFGWCEMDDFHPKWREEVSEIAQLKARALAAERERDEANAAVAEWEAEAQKRLDAIPPLSDEAIQRFKEYVGNAPGDNVMLREQVSDLTADRDTLRARLAEVEGERDKALADVKVRWDIAEGWKQKYAMAGEKIAEQRAAILAAETDAGRLAELIEEVNENHEAIREGRCDCYGCDRRRAALAAHAGTEPT